MNDEKERNQFVEELIHTYHKELLHSARKRLPNFEDTEDVMNELWYMVVLKADILYSHPNKIAWLYTALNICIKRFYSQKHTEIRTIPFDETLLDTLITEDDYKEKDSLEEYKKILTELEFKYIKYKFEDEMNNQEIAEKENKSYTSITTLGNRVKEKIKKMINQT